MALAAAKPSQREHLRVRRLVSVITCFFFLTQHYPGKSTLLCSFQLIHHWVGSLAPRTEGVGLPGLGGAPRAGRGSSNWAGLFRLAKISENLLMLSLCGSVEGRCDFRIRKNRVSVLC